MCACNLLARIEMKYKLQLEFKKWVLQVILQNNSVWCEMVQPSPKYWWSSGLMMRAVTSWTNLLFSFSLCSTLLLLLTPYFFSPISPTFSNSLSLPLSVCLSLTLATMGKGEEQRGEREVCELSTAVLMTQWSPAEQSQSGRQSEAQLWIRIRISATTVGWKQPIERGMNGKCNLML